MPTQVSHHAKQKETLSEIARLDRFYHSEPGRMAALFLRKAIQPQLKLDATIDRLGFGYPFMSLPCQVPMPVLIPSEMGALAYGDETGVISASISSEAWPIASDSVNQLVMCHGLEYCHDNEACLAEANRVLVSAGELFLMVPNRASLWVRDETSPLGHGRPFSKGQISKLLLKTGFEIQKISRALFLPPSMMGWPLRLAKAVDHMGHYGWGMFGGVIIVRATKLHYATKPLGRPALMVSLSGALGGPGRPVAPLPFNKRGMLDD